MTNAAAGEDTVRLAPPLEMNAYIHNGPYREFKDNHISNAKMQATKSSQGPSYLDHYQMSNQYPIVEP